MPCLRRHAVNAVRPALEPLPAEAAADVVEVVWLLEPPELLPQAAISPLMASAVSMSSARCGRVCVGVTVCFLLVGVSSAAVAGAEQGVDG